MTPLPQVRGGCERLGRMLADVALEPYRQSLVKAHAQLMSDIDAAIARGKENRRG